jgi:hypothetical protein
VLGLVGLFAGVVLLLSRTFPGLTSSDTPATASATSPQAPSAAPSTTEPNGQAEPPGTPRAQPVFSRVTDPRAGISYAVLPGRWRAWDLPAFRGFESNTGYYQVVQTDAPGGLYWANVTSGPVSSTARVADPRSAARRLADQLAAGYYPKHVRRQEVQRALNVDGRPAYLVRFLAVFDRAASAGYTAKSELVNVLVVNTGRSSLGGLYVSLPDTVRSSWSSVDALLGSVRVLG